MDDLTQLRFDAFLDAVADRTPAPGGGSVAAAVGALAASLARMVVAYSVSKNTDPAVRAGIENAAAQLRRADELLRALVTEDAHAYSVMAAAGKKARGDPNAKDEHQRAVLDAVGVPMQIAALTCDLLVTLNGMTNVANPRLSSDLASAAVLGEAAARAARLMVRVNLPELADARRRDLLAGAADRIAEKCSALRASIEGHVTVP